MIFQRYRVDENIFFIRKINSSRNDISFNKDKLT